MDYPYWDNKLEFKRQSELLQKLYDDQAKTYGSGNRTSISLIELAERQRLQLISCIYLAGGRIDNKACLGSQNLGILFSSLPTDYIKAISPSFHSDHDEIFFCTDGQIVIEYTKSLDKSTHLETVVLSPGDYFIAKVKWPHRVSLAPIRILLEDSGDVISIRNEKEIKQTKASFLAVKAGSLTGKGIYEDMSRWQEAQFEHPLVTAWIKDEELMKKIRANKSISNMFHILPLSK